MSSTKDKIVAILRSRVRSYSPAEDVAPHVTNAEEVADLILREISQVESARRYVAKATTTDSVWSTTHSTAWQVFDTGIMTPKIGEDDQPLCILLCINRRVAEQAAYCLNEEEEKL